MVDELGGFWDAVDAARREAGLPEDKTPLLRFYSTGRGIRLASLFGDTAYPDFLKTLLGNAPVERLYGCFAVMPFRIEVK